MTSEQAEAVERLRSVGRRRVRALEQAAALEAEIAEAIIAADAAGIPRLRIAREAGVVRATVYNVLKRAAPASRLSEIQGEA